MDHLSTPSQVRLHAAVSSMLSLVALLAAASAGATEFTLPAAGDVVGQIGIVVTREQDTLLDIARQHGLGYNEITAANPGVDPWLPGAGTRIVVPTQFVLPSGTREGMVINLAQMRLFYFPTHEPDASGSVITHPIGIGVDIAPTPMGVTTIVRKTIDPTWYPPDSIRRRRAEEGEILPAMVPPGPDNPLGNRALYLGLPGYLIHGTNRPWGIGMRVSSGCIRLYPEDIEMLFDQVPVGTPVRIVREPYLLGEHDGVPVLQAFRPPDDAPAEESFTPLMEELVRRYPRGAVDLAKALQVAKEKRGVPTPIAPGDAKP
jgi:L,D-transpeptidase ErfK/SrfK